MLDRPSIVCRVVRPMACPIAADPGDVLVAWPGHPTHSLAVVRHQRVVRTRHVPDGVLYGALLDLFLSARIRLPLTAQRRLLTQQQ
jgi:hypothetical protein